MSLALGSLPLAKHRSGAPRDAHREAESDAFHLRQWGSVFRWMERVELGWERGKVGGGGTSSGLHHQILTSLPGHKALKSQAVSQFQ